MTPVPFLPYGLLTVVKITLFFLASDGMNVLFI